jgi:nitrogen regulatory protein P-II 1
MKKVEAIIRTERFKAVKEALESSGITSINVKEVRGRGEEIGFKLQGRAFEYLVRDIHRTLLETVVAEEKVDAVVQDIIRAAWTGSEGDGLVFVSPVIDAVRIRTGERGEDAI